MANKQDLFNSLYPKMKEAMKEAMILYNRSLDPEDKEIVKIQTGFGSDININLDTSKGKMTVTLEKSSEVLGTAFSALISPILVDEFDKYNNSSQSL